MKYRRVKRQCGVFIPDKIPEFRNSKRIFYGKGFWHKERRHIKFFIFGNRSLLILFFLVFYFFGEIAIAVAMHHWLILIYTKVFSDIRAI